ncbi:hypothetical protein TNCT_655091 [Trichonephila clavata]|uniref:Uncharacterized protein n=1 Tax=Trichonephila clavata TaxID=2740835 RepID=A0A8X6GRC9_TRICU|nr:hypothetical protein TNCT_655091 [Trichonephila clavata]
MSALKSDCRKFSPNVFNKTKCQNCFRTKDAHSAEALENNRFPKPRHSHHSSEKGVGECHSNLSKPEENKMLLEKRNGYYYIAPYSSANTPTFDSSPLRKLDPQQNASSLLANSSLVSFTTEKILIESRGQKTK